MLGGMKLSANARNVGVFYRTAFRWFKSGKIQGRQMDTGTILITEPTGEPTVPEHSLKVAIYTRVSATENKDNLDGQARRLVATRSSSCFATMQCAFGITLTLARGTSLVIAMAACRRWGARSTSAWIATTFTRSALTRSPNVCPRSRQALLMDKFLRRCHKRKQNLCM